MLKRAIRNIDPIVTDIIIIVLVLLAGMWQLTAFHSIMKWDILDINLPWRYFTSECIRNNHLPLWNPYMSSGFPQAADPMTWYPLSWIIGLLFGYDLLTLQYEYLFHLFIGGTGIYMFTVLLNLQRPVKLITAISYMFSGLFISNAQHFGWVISAAWIPWVVYFFIKFMHYQKIRTGLLFVLNLYCLLSGGYPAFFIITLYLLLVIFIWFIIDHLRKNKSVKLLLLNTLWICVLFLILSSVVLISSFELYSQITLSDKFTPEFVNSYSLPFRALVSFLFPYSTTYSVDFFGTDFSLVNSYFGWVLLIFLVYAILLKEKRALVFIPAGLFMLSVAMADIFPFRKWLSYLPFMNIFRFPVIFRYFAYTLFILAGAVGLNEFIIHKRKERKLMIAVFLLLVIIFIFIFLSCLHINIGNLKRLLFFDFRGFNSVATLYERILLQALISLLILCMLLISFLRLSFNKIVVILVVLTILDMVVSVQLNINATVVQNINPGPTQKAFSSLPKGFPEPVPEIPAITISDITTPGIPFLWRNLNVYFKRPAYDGYTPYQLRTYKEAETSDSCLAILKFPLIFLSDTLNKTNTIDSKYYDSLSYSKINIIAYSPSLIELLVKTDKKQLLTFLQNIYPGWKATINGKEDTILKTNLTFMSVWLNNGVNRVKFEFKPVKIIAGFYISITCFLLILLILLMGLFGILRI